MCLHLLWTVVTIAGLMTYCVYSDLVHESGRTEYMYWRTYYISCGTVVKSVAWSNVHL